MNRRELCLAMGAGQMLLLSGTSAARGAGMLKASAELHELDLASASRAIRSGKLSATDLVRACLRRIDAANGRLNAVITTMRDQALAQAATLDAEASDGKFRSPLHGIPIALKDNMDVAGVRTTNGSAVRKDHVAARDARVVEQLRQAGAVIIAKTNMSEFALASATSASSFFGPVRNPWNADHVSGGSSGGSGAAVASGMALGALGTDSGGSVRIPSAWCGLTGLKPTLGLVSFNGVGPTPPLQDTIGPMARSAEDIAILFSQMTGYDPQDVASIDRPREDYVAALGRTVSKLRVGLPRRPFFEGLDPQVAKAVDAAVGVIAGLTAGARDVVFGGPALADLPDMMATSADIYAGHSDIFPSRANDYQPLIRNALASIRESLESEAEGSPAQKIARYIRSRDGMIRLQRTADSLFDGFDLIVLPTLKILPYMLKTALHSEYENGPPLHSSIVANTILFNILGLPALTLPCGFSKEGLPIGIEICGPRYSEGTLLALGHAYQRATPWHKRRPT